MPYGHSRTGNGIIQGKHLSHYTCKCTNYQEHYFNRFFTDSFSCLFHSPSQRPIQTGMQGRGDTKREVGTHSSCVFYCCQCSSRPLQLGASQKIKTRQSPQHFWQVTLLWDKAPGITTGLAQIRAQGLRVLQRTLGQNLPWFPAAQSSSQLSAAVASL